MGEEMHCSDIRAENMIYQSVVGVELLTHPALFTLPPPPKKIPYCLKMVDISENK